MPLSRKDIERMSEVQRAETSCRLSLFPTLSNREIGQYMGGYSINSVEKFIQAGRAMGLESSSDRYPADAQPTRPSPEEMDWRFANQDAKQFCTRFNGKSMPKAQTVILDLDLEAKLPDPWRAAIFGTKPSSPPLAPATRPLRRKVEEVGDDEGEAKVIGRVAILDTDIAIGIEDPDEVDVINNLVEHFRRSYKIEGASWQVVKPKIDIALLIHRIQKQTTESPAQVRQKADALSKLEKDYSDSLKKLPFERKTGESEFDLWRDCIDKAPDLLAQRGYRATMSCQECGTLLTPYLIIYRNNVELFTWARTTLAADIDTAIGERDLKHICRRILDRWDENPVLQRELRDLGHAWNEPLVRGFLGLLNRHPGVTEAAVEEALGSLDPEQVTPTQQHLVRDALRPLLAAAQPLTLDELAAILGEFLEVGPIVFDPANPFSALNRVVTDATGKLRVMTPEE